MLKLIYTEMGLHMDYEAASLEAVVSQHVILSVRTGQSLHVEMGQASFLLPIQAPGLEALDAALHRYVETLEVTCVDAEYVEVDLGGTWIAQTIDAHEGMFLVAYDYETELILHRLWHTAGLPLTSVI
ncbi:MAG: alr0857 family protein [Cyanobacteria bacterium P01_A01_bin.17]